MPDRPANFYLDALRKLRGEPKVTSPHEHPHSLKIERVYSRPRGWTPPALGDADPNAGYAAAGARLTDIQLLSSDNLFQEFYTVYEALGSRAEQDLWNEQPRTFPYGENNNPRITRKYRFFVDSPELTAFVIGGTADTLIGAAVLFNLQAEDENAIIVVLTAFFDDIPSVTAQEQSEDGNEGLGMSIAFPYGASAFPVVTYRARVLNSAYAPATDNQACPIPNYTGLVLTDQGKEPAQDAPTVSVMTLEFQFVPGIILTAADDASKLPRQLTATPAYYLNNEEIITYKQVVAYGTRADATSATILSSKVEATGTLKALKTNVTRPDPTLPIKYLPKMLEGFGGAKGIEYRQDVRVIDTGSVTTNTTNLNAAIDSAISLIGLVAPWFSVTDYRTNPLSPLEAELVYTIAPDFVTLYGAESSVDIPEKFLTGFDRQNIDDWVDTTNATARSYVDAAAFYPTGVALSIKVVPETIYRAKRTTTKLPDGSVLPTLTSTERNEHGQIESTVESITNGTTPLPTITALIPKASQPAIGGGLFLRSITTVPSLYTGDEYTVEIPDPFPPEFRALAPTTTYATTGVGTASMPTLGMGQLRVTVRQVDAQTIRTESTIINLMALPLAIPDTHSNAEGQTVARVRTLNTGLQTFAPTAFVTGEVVNLGNGLSVLTTETIAGFGVRTIQTFDKSLGLPRVATEQKMPNAAAAEFVGSLYTDITPEGDLASVIRQQADIPALLDGFWRAYPTTARLNLPDTLKGIVAIINASAGDGSSTETTDKYVLINSGGLNLQAPNSCDGYVSLQIEVIPTILQTWAEDVDVLDLVFLMPVNVGKDAILTKAGEVLYAFENDIAALDPAKTVPILGWPLFQPTAVNLVLYSEKATVRAGASSRESISQGTGGASLILTHGGSGSRDAMVESKAVDIRPTIHAGFDIVGQTTAQETVTVTAQAQVGEAVSGASTQMAVARAAVTPTAIPATAGATSIPTTGVSAQRIDVEPYDAGRNKVRVRLFDWTNLTNANGPLQAAGATGLGSTNPGGSIGTGTGGTVTVIPSPAAPHLIGATSSAVVVLSWPPNVAGDVVDFYYVYRSTTLGGGYASLGTVAQASDAYIRYNDSSVKPSTTYYYYVAAHNAQGLSAPSNTFTAAVPAPDAGNPNPGSGGAVPSSTDNYNLVGSAVSNGSVYLYWDRDQGQGITNWNVYRNTSATGTFSKIASVDFSVHPYSNTTTSYYIDSGTTTGTTYYYYITAVNPTGESQPSNTVHVTSAVSS